MMSDDSNTNLDGFRSDFETLTGHPPFPWQQRLYARMAGLDRQGWPDAVDVPTGLGKTSAVACWLLALAANPAGVPRRLVYVVNRRTIVDQVTDVTVTMWQRLRDEPRLEAMRKRLSRDVSNRGDDEVGDAMAISTLRGEFADNGAWRADPARASIIVGTPDLIGSALVFAGYRVGRGSLAMHAGLLGHDCLLVHDEAHLSPAMQVLLERVAELQAGDGSPRPARVLALSATQRGNARDVLRLDDDDLGNKSVVERIDAHKRLSVEDVKETPDEKVPATRKRWLEIMTAKVLAYDGDAVRMVVYVRSPDDAAALRDAIAKTLKKSADKRLALLTGRLRGKERDKLAEGPVMTALREATPVPETIYLVATSAGEVGADLDADHLVCDLTTADALIQRLGRVNRRGKRTKADGCNVDLVAGPDPEPKQDAAAAHARWAARQKTLNFLRTLPTGEDGRIDASPRATREDWKLPDDCREPEPETLPLTEMMVSALSMTSIRRTRRVDGRTVPTWPLLPNVATLIHGFVEDQSDVTLAWRAEVPYLADADHSAEEVERLTKKVLEACPVLAAERLTVPTGVAADWIKARVKNLKNDSQAALLVGNNVGRLRLDGEVQVENFAGRTLLLPPAFGGLDASGALDAKADGGGRQLDVGDTGDVHRYFVRERDDGGYECRPVAANAEAWAEVEAKAGVTPRAAALAAIMEGGHMRRLIVPLRDAEEPGTRLDLIITRKSKAREDIADAPSIEQHNEEVRARAERFAIGLGLPDDYGHAVFVAAARHDTGKGRALWQTYAGNTKFDQPVAKPMPGTQNDWRVLDGYRHEYGSLLDALMDSVADPLTLHLIAAHHGHARPHFERPFDPERPDHLDASPAAVALRFDALQKRHGPWGLAWLESLLRAADRTVSAGDFDAEEDADA